MSGQSEHAPRRARAGAGDPRSCARPRAQQTRAGCEPDRPDDDRHDDEIRSAGHADGGHHGRRPGRGERADAPQRVQRRQDGAAVAVLDRRAVGVHRDIGHARHGTQHDEHPGERESARREQHEGQRDVPDRERHGQRRASAEAPDEVAGGRHGRDRAARHREQHEPERAGTQVEVVLDARDERRPRRVERAVDEEHRRDRNPRRAQLAGRARPACRPTELTPPA